MVKLTIGEMFLKVVPCSSHLCHGVRGPPSGMKFSSHESRYCQTTQEPFQQRVREMHSFSDMTKGLEAVTGGSKPKH